MDSNIASLSRFVKLYSDTKKRIEMLESIYAEARANDGIITLSYESLQDDIVNYKTPPSMLMPFIDAELNEKRNLIIELDKKVQEISLIIVKEDSHD